MQSIHLINQLFLLTLCPIVLSLYHVRHRAITKSVRGTPNVTDQLSNDRRLRDDRYLLRDVELE